MLHASTDTSPRKFSKPSISIIIDPIVKVAGNYSIPTASKTTSGWSIGGCLQEGCGNDNIGYCAAVDNNLCAKRINNIEGVRYGIKIRITEPPITWIHGRLLNADFHSNITSDGVVWSIEAEPVALPVISGWIPNTEMVQKLGVSPTRLEETSWDGPQSSGQWAIKEFNRWIPFMGDRAKAIQKRWSIGSIVNGQMLNGKTLEECLKPQAIAGLVVTNATVYQGDPPTWNTVDSTLDYQVAAPHLTPGGNEFLGIYQLKINSDFARCIYELDNVPLVASISVVDNKETKKVATTSMSAGADWINFNVSGFTFSAPTIKVKLLKGGQAPQDSLASNTKSVENLKNESTPQPVIVQKTTKRSTITCIKGKLTKKVTAVMPKCPVGYKKK